MPSEEATTSTKTFLNAFGVAREANSNICKASEHSTNVAMVIKRNENIIVIIEEYASPTNQLLCLSREVSENSTLNQVKISILTEHSIYINKDRKSILNHYLFCIVTSSNFAHLVNIITIT